MMTYRIPEQLGGAVFLPLKAREKMPIEAAAGWPENPDRRLDRAGAQRWLDQGGNYAVCAGLGTGIVVIECDHEEAARAVEESLPQTLCVRSGRGGRHYYFREEGEPRVPNVKIHDPRDPKAEEWGGIKAWHKYVVGPGSTHPNGNRYEVADDLPIAPIRKEYLEKGPISVMLNGRVREQPKADPDSKRMALPFELERIPAIAALEHKRGAEISGTHPIHGSETENNFHVNLESGQWYCFRHEVGGGWLCLLAMLRGLIRCEDVASGEWSRLRARYLMKGPREWANKSIRILTEGKV